MVNVWVESTLGSWMQGRTCGYIDELVDELIDGRKNGFFNGQIKKFTTVFKKQ
jgi:hypothetical protein